MDDGREAVRMYQRARSEGAPYAAVIVDLTVPGGMGGLPTLRALKAIDEDVRVIVSSGYSDSPVLSDHRAHGFCGVVAKPFTFDELGWALQDAHASHRAERKWSHQ